MIFYLAMFVGKMAILGGILGASITVVGICAILLKYYISQNKKK